MAGSGGRWGGVRGQELRPYVSCSGHVMAVSSHLLLAVIEVCFSLKSHKEDNKTSISISL